MTTPPTHIWYVSYGSNLWWPRFRCYLEGGIAPGGTRDQPGARNTAPPVDDGPCTLEHPLYFGDESRTWGGGGVAYIDAEVSGAVTRGRRYLLTLGQFSDVAAQEGGRMPSADLVIDELLATGRQLVGRGWYDLLLHLGDHEGVPMLTFTTSRSRASVSEHGPSDAYASTIRNGLIETHAMAEADADAYLAAAAPQPGPGRGS